MHVGSIERRNLGLEFEYCPEYISLGLLLLDCNCIHSTSVSKPLVSVIFHLNLSFIYLYYMTLPNHVFPKNLPVP